MSDERLQCILGNSNSSGKNVAEEMLNFHHVSTFVLKDFTAFAGAPEPPDMNFEETRERQ
jgi:hypothetical protein